LKNTNTTDERKAEIREKLKELVRSLLSLSDLSHTKLIVQGVEIKDDGTAVTAPPKGSAKAAAKAAEKKDEA